MKPFVWITALLLAAIFLAGAIFAAVDVMSHANNANIVSDPELKVAAGWLVSGLIFLSLGMRGWKNYRRVNSANSPK